MTTFKKFVGYYKPYKKTFMLDMFCAFILSLADLSLPFLTALLINEVFIIQDKTQMFQRVVNICITLVVINIIRAASEFYVISYGHIMGAKMEADMRNDLFIHMEKLSFSYYDNNDTGVMMSRIISDLFDVTELAHHGPEDLFISVIKLLGSFLLLFSINSNLTLILIIVVLAIAIFSVQINKKIKVIQRENREKIGDVNAIVQDSLSGIRVVKSFTNEEVEVEKFKDGNNLFLKSKKNNYLNMGVYFSINSVFQGVLYILVFILSGYYIMKGQMEVRSVITFILYINVFLEPIKKLINFTETFQNGYTGFERMQDIMRIKPEIRDSKNAKDVDEIKGDIRFKNVTFKYDNDEGHVLKDINFSIPKEKTIALVGPSGGGKTTICSLIPRFYEVSSGEILLDDINIKDIKVESLRKNIGIVQQDVYIFNSTIKENISYGNINATDEEIIEASKRANLHDYIMTLEDGYDTVVGERGVKFSGGQKQRISIARVFLKNPPILLLDEATSALDNESEKYIQDSLDELAKNRTTLIIAHRLSTIRNADNIIVLTEDGIEEQGNHEELLQKNGLYADLYNLQFDNVGAV